MRTCARVCIYIFHDIYLTDLNLIETFNFYISIVKKLKHKIIIIN